MLVSSCKHEVDVAVEPAISFGTQVKPIISANCTQSGCHGPVNPQRFQLLTYDDVIQHGGVANTDPVDTKLYQVIVGKKEDVMPPSPYSPLDDSQIKVILLWMRQGAKNN